MVVGNGVKNIQAAAYNGAHTVSILKHKKVLLLKKVQELHNFAAIQL